LGVVAVLTAVEVGAATIGPYDVMVAGLNMVQIVLLAYLAAGRPRKEHNTKTEDARQEKSDNG
jgi:hypothetical protein